MAPRYRPRPEYREDDAGHSELIAGDIAKNTGGGGREDSDAPCATDLEMYYKFIDGSATRDELAREHSMTVFAVSRIVTKVDNWLAKKFVVQIAQLRVSATMRLERIYSNAMKSYYKSLEDFAETTTRSVNGKTTVTEKRHGQAGSAAFLAQAREAVNEMLQVWGGHAPRAIRLETPDATRVGGKSPQQALQDRKSHLDSLLRNMLPDGATS